MRFSLHVLRILWAMVVLRLNLCFWWLWQFCWVLPRYLLTDGSLSVDGALGLKRDPEVMCHSHHIISQDCTIKVIDHGWCWPGSPGWGGVCWASNHKIQLSFSFPCCPLWKEVTGCCPHAPKNLGLLLRILESIYTNFSEFFCMENLPFRSHLFIYCN